MNETFDINDIVTLKAENRWNELIQMLDSMANSGDGKILQELRNVRIEAFDFVSDSEYKGSNSPCPPEAVDPFPELKGFIPEINSTDLNIDYLAGAIRHHGALIVRNLIDSALATELVSDIDQVMKSVKKYDENPKEYINDDWYASLPNPPKEKQKYYRMPMMKKATSRWTMLSPKMAKSIFDIFNELELKPLITRYFDDRPSLSVKKWVVRKMTPKHKKPDWHQDGIFMGKNIKSLNLWMALTECGEGTSKPGLDILPKRLNDIVPGGLQGARLNWTVSHEYVAEHFDVAPQRPTFNKGDAIFFDHLNLHATSFSEQFTEQRYAIETWFFGQSSSPKNQIPIIW